MGLLKKIFGNTNAKEITTEVKTEEKSSINWIPLNAIEEINQLKEMSKTQYVGVFKHSTRCVISKTVLKRFEESFPDDLNIAMYYIDLLNYREVSSEIGTAFEVLHQSPQFVLIRDEKAISHASHYDILEMEFSDLIK